IRGGDRRRGPRPPERRRSGRRRAPRASAGGRLGRRSPAGAGFAGRPAERGTARAPEVSRTRTRRAGSPRRAPPGPGDRKDAGGPALQESVARVEPEVALELLGLGAVALKAVVGQDRSDPRVEKVDAVARVLLARQGGSERRRDPGGGDQEEREMPHGDSPMR